MNGTFHEVYAKIRLVPLGKDDVSYNVNVEDRVDSYEKPTSFVKTLTQSDANYGGGFSVPRYYVETIYPHLNYSLNPHVQTITTKDVHGEIWKFRHIYSGNPRRHLLKTGWNTFVNQKKMVAGDSVVFVRTDNEDLCVGIRRVKRGDSNIKVRPEDVIEATSLAASRQPFKFTGTVSSVGAADPFHWPNSPWRLLQVRWDEPDRLQNVERVSPWLVELLSNTPPIQYSPPFSSNTIGPSSSLCGPPENVHGSIQGARHAGFDILLLDPNLTRKLQPGLFPSTLKKINSYSTDSQLDEDSDDVSYTLTVGSSSSFKMDKSVEKVFLLFGQPIHVVQQSSSDNYADIDSRASQDACNQGICVTPASQSNITVADAM
ncbi:auxin response factor 18-like [Rutidosis leptorrhynchoides]|uniref:auxin response factor 18-like n=1 Tax=Rutidosis leptorrhynchoides TaxID=125765 RepID=UPI003A99CA1A